jgi:hypothetical protein
MLLNILLSLLTIVLRHVELEELLHSWKKGYATWSWRNCYIAGRREGIAVLFSVLLV